MFELASAAVRPRPEVTVAEAMGPNPRCDRSTPLTLTLVTDKPCGGSPFGPSWDWDGTTSLVSVSVSPPAAAATPRTCDTSATDEASSTPRPGAGRSQSTDRGCAPGLNAPPLLLLRLEAGAGAMVTVTSVPIPYNEWSTAPCASLTPAAAAVTVTTRPTPTASPSVTRRAWRARRISSPRR